MASGTETTGVPYNVTLSALGNASTMNPMNCGEDSPKECRLYTFIMGLVIGALCLLGTAGNILAFIVFWKDKVKTSTSLLFQGLSVIDIMLLVTAFPIYCVPTFVDYTGLTWWKPNVHTGMIVYVVPWAFVAQTSTIWVTVLVGVNRYIAVCKPYQAPRLCNVTQARKQLAVVLLFCVLYNVPKFWEAKMVEKTHNGTVFYCPDMRYEIIRHPQLYQILYRNVMYMIFLLALPLLILTVLNTRLISALKALRRKRAEMQSLRQQQDNNVTFVLVVVIIVFTVCQTPALLNQIFWNALSDSQRNCGGFQFYFSRISNTLVILNSSVNFVIYFLFNTRFKQVLLQNIFKVEYKKVRTEVSGATLPAEQVNGDKPLPVPAETQVTVMKGQSML